MKSITFFPRFNNRIFQMTLSAVALIGLLGYTFNHTSSLLARYVDPDVFAYAAAVGIELSIVAMSLRIGELKKARKTPWFQYGALAGTLLVSAIANTAEGFHTSQGVPLTASTVSRMDTIQAIIALCDTELIPLIVLSLSEILGSDVQLAIKDVQKQRTYAEKKTFIPGDLSRLEQANEARQDKTKERTDRILSYYDQGMDIKEIATAEGVSTRTVKRHLNGQQVTQ